MTNCWVSFKGSKNPLLNVRIGLTQLSRVLQR